MVGTVGGATGSVVGSGSSEDKDSGEGVALLSRRPSTTLRCCGDPLGSASRSIPWRLALRPCPFVASGSNVSTSVDEVMREYMRGIRSCCPYLSHFETRKDKTFAIFTKKNYKYNYHYAACSPLTTLPAPAPAPAWTPWAAVRPPKQE